MALLGTQYAVTTSAASVRSILGLTGDVGRKHAKQLDVKNANGNTGIVYAGKSNVTNVPANALYEAIANQSFTLGPFDNHLIDLDEVFLVGSVAAEKVYIAANF